MDIEPIVEQVIETRKEIWQKYGFDSEKIREAIKEKKDGKNYLEKLAGGVTSILLAIGSFYLFYNVLCIDIEIHAWSTTQATILSSCLEQVQSKVMPGETASPAWIVNATYSYKVEGITYKGDRVSNSPPVRLHGIWIRLQTKSWSLFVTASQ